MLSLVLDTTSRTTAVGIHDGERWLALKAETPERGHGDVLASTVAMVLGEARVGVSSLSRIVLGIGPGSFTGIRVGLAFVRGLAFTGSLGICAVNSFERERARQLLRGAVAAERTVVACFAKRNTVYLEEARGISILSFDDARRLLAPGVSAGAILLVGDAAEMLFPVVDGDAPPRAHGSSANENLDALLHAAHSKPVQPSLEINAFYVGDAEISKPKPKGMVRKG